MAADHSAQGKATADQGKIVRLTKQEAHRESTALPASIERPDTKAKGFIYFMLVTAKEGQEEGRPSEAVRTKGKLFQAKLRSGEGLIQWPTPSHELHKDVF